MLDIGALRLTQEERKQLPGRDTYFAGHKWPYWRVEAAQLAKVAWGLQTWLGIVDLELAADLAQALEQANIERPAAGKATG